MIIDAERYISEKYVEIYTIYESFVRKNEKIIFVKRHG